MSERMRLGKTAIPTVGRWGAAACVGLALMSMSANAAADDAEDTLLVGAIAGVAAVDISFTVRAALLAGNGGDAEFGYSLAQTLVTAPQALVFNTSIVGFMQTHEGAEVFAALHVPATMSTALAIHGAWSLAAPDEDQAFMFLASTHMAVNTMWTSFLLGTATTDRDNFDDDGAAAAGVYEVVTTAPGVAIGIHQALESNRFTVGWVGLAAWSGLLSVHGALFATGKLNPSDWDDENIAITNLSLAPTSFGPPVEGAPATPGMLVGGAF